MQLGQLADRGTTRAVQTRFSISPDYTLNLSPEIAVVLPFDMPELLYHQGWFRWCKGFQVAAVAAQNSQARIGNPDTSGALFVVERIIVSIAAAATNVTYNSGAAVGSTSLGTLVTGNMTVRDSRISSLTNPRAQLSLTNTVAPFTVSGCLVDVLANTALELPGAPWVLLPGSTLTVQDQTVNQSMDVSFTWRERILQEQENTP